MFSFLQDLFVCVFILFVIYMSYVLIAVVHHLHIIPLFIGFTGFFFKFKNIRLRFLMMFYFARCMA